MSALPRNPAISRAPWGRTPVFRIPCRARSSSACSSPRSVTDHAGRATDPGGAREDRKSTRLNSSHLVISYAVFCLKKKKTKLTIEHNGREDEGGSSRGIRKIRGDLTWWDEVCSCSRAVVL